ncbi:nucleotidyltransferase domain-containing protein [Acanthopleuribacter pedis]|uniref:Nucleotidyltransferase family protein n=1 Tax=Acanthopleuribacter pedis TaxID=442870 RepID=A0A8J7QBC3_9BACT|nr:hypothetical protein [Acanthopleuribacter pedis]MBO1317771.1 hypothetical protein [Acanthopleuribacter pedis]
MNSGLVGRLKSVLLRLKDFGWRPENFSMNIQHHFKELLALLEKNQVEYVVVGGYAVAYHGHPRFTKDIDIFYRRDDENLEKLKSSLVVFGFRLEDLDERLFEFGNIVKIGVEPSRIDLLNEIDG